MNEATIPSQPAVQPEPWLRGTYQDTPPVQRAVVHALELAREDIRKWCGGLSEEELHARPFELPSIAFHLRHIARSLDRFLCYVDGAVLNDAQRAALASEMEPQGSRQAIEAEFHAAIEQTQARLQEIQGRALDSAIKIGRKGLAATLGGVLVHMADHTQRHVGQAVTTAKILRSQRTS